jgi:hypothetical protein
LVRWNAALLLNEPLAHSNARMSLGTYQTWDSSGDRTLTSLLSFFNTLKVVRSNSWKRFDVCSRKVNSWFNRSDAPNNYCGDQRPESRGVSSVLNLCQHASETFLSNIPERCPGLHMTYYWIW